MRNLLFAMVLLTSASAQAQEWTEADTWREGGVIALEVVDWGQTLNIARHPSSAPVAATWGHPADPASGYREANWLLGTHPSTDKVNAYFISSIALHVLLARLLPDRWRLAYQYATMGFEASVIAHNFRLGLKVTF